MRYSYLAVTNQPLIVALWKYRKTGLTYAVAGGSIEIFNRLLELGADPKEADVAHAAAEGTVEIFKRVLELGADPKKATEARALYMSCLLVLHLFDCEWPCLLGLLFVCSDEGHSVIMSAIGFFCLLLFFASPPLSPFCGANNSWPSSYVFLDCLVLRIHRWSRMEIRR